MTPSNPNFIRADRIGSAYQSTALRYCVNDNTYEEVPIQRQAWACPLTARPLPSTPLGDLYETLFGAA